VDGRDFLNLQRDLGDTPEAALALAAAATAVHAVPEPDGFLLIYCATVALAGFRPRSTRANLR
jgi:hypothetical protein